MLEVDETYVGGKGRGYRGNKTIVAGATQRDGPVRMERIPDVRRATLHGFIKRTVRDEAEAIYTDELVSYLGIENDDTRHATVNRGAEEWVVGDVHTNSIEGVWSLFKRSIVGSVHKDRDGRLVAVEYQEAPRAALKGATRMPRRLSSTSPSRPIPRSRSQRSP